MCSCNFWSMFVSKVQQLSLSFVWSLFQSHRSATELYEVTTWWRYRTAIDQLLLFSSYDRRLIFFLEWSHYTSLCLTACTAYYCMGQIYDVERVYGIGLHTFFCHHTSRTKISVQLWMHYSCFPCKIYFFSFKKHQLVRIVTSLMSGQHCNYLLLCHC